MPVPSPTLKMSSQGLLHTCAHFQQQQLKPRFFVFQKDAFRVYFILLFIKTIVYESRDMTLFELSSENDPLFLILGCGLY